MAAEVKLLKIDSSGMPIEMDSANDQIVMNQFSITGGGPVLGTSGLDMNAQNISDSGDLSFTAVTNTIAGIQNQNLVDKTAAASISGAWDFASGEFTFPAAVSATPAEGDAYWSDAANTLYVYDADSSTWQDMRQANSTAALDVIYKAGPVAGLVTKQVVYVSANDTASPAIADGSVKAYALGIALDTVAQNANCRIREKGVADCLTTATFGAPQFLSSTVAGAIVASAPTASGKDVVRLGFAKNASDLDIQIQYIGKRA